MLGAVLGLLAVITSYVSFGMYLKHLFVHDMGFTRVIAQALILLTPFILYFTGLKNFLKAMGFMGALLGGAEGILVLITIYKAKRMNCSREPEYVALASGAVMELANVLKGV